MRRRVKNPWDVWLYMSADYAALELCTLAQVCIYLGLDSEMAKAINIGQDLHTRLAARVKGISYAEAMLLKAAKDLEILALRQSMKAVNFGRPGLMGPPKMVFTARKDGVYFCELADGWKGETGRGCAQHPRRVTYGKGAGYPIPPTCVRCLELSKEYSDLWYAEWPEMRAYHEITVAAAKDGERGVPLESFGTGLLRMETSANAVSNHLFQNLAAQGAKHAGYLLSKESYADPSSILYNNSRLVVFVHDENFCEMREPVAAECAAQASEILRAGMREFCPDVLITIEPALMRRWFKGADKAVDRNGRLKPWWPVDPRCAKTWPAHTVEKCKCWQWPADRDLMAEDMAA